MSTTTGCKNVLTDICNVCIYFIVGRKIQVGIVWISGPVNCTALFNKELLSDRPHCEIVNPMINSKQPVHSHITEIVEADGNISVPVCVDFITDLLIKYNLQIGIGCKMEIQIQFDTCEVKLGNIFSSGK